MRSVSDRATVLVAIVLLGGACTRTAPPGPAVAEPACLLQPGAADTPDTITLGVTDSLHRSDAPRAQNHAERLVFGLLYPGLVRLDCQGRLMPGLAARWTGGANIWSLQLAGDAHFTDSVPLTPQRVAASWLQAGAGALAGLRFEATTPSDSGTLVLGLDIPSDSLPAFLAAGALAPVLPVAGGWPLGAGAYRIIQDSGGLLLVPGREYTRFPVLRVRMAPGADPRDLLDAGVQLLVTDDPATIDYALAHDSLATVPLPWNRVYVLILPQALVQGAAPGELRRALAGDAVRVEARAARDSLPLRSGGAGPARRGATPRVVYPATDPTAGELARRLVSLASRAGGDTASSWAAHALPGGPSLVAVGLQPEQFARALARGDAAGYVASRDLLLPAPPPGGGVAVPLIETRSRAIVRAGTGGFEIQGDGTLRVRGTTP